MTTPMSAIHQLQFVVCDSFLIVLLFTGSIESPLTQKEFNHGSTD